MGGWRRTRSSSTDSRVLPSLADYGEIVMCLSSIAGQGFTGKKNTPQDSVRTQRVDKIICC
jgi:hypothetical protein